MCSNILPDLVRFVKVPEKNGMDSRVTLFMQLAAEKSKIAMAGVCNIVLDANRQPTYPSGPGFRISDFESNRIIGDLQFQGTQRIMNGQLTPVSGTVKSVHAYLNMWVSSTIDGSVVQLR